MTGIDKNTNSSTKHKFLEQLLLFLPRSRTKIPEYYTISAHKHMDIRQLPEFGEIADEVIKQKRTYLNYDRLYTIYQALQPLLKKSTSPLRIHLAEVGVWRGGCSYFICSLLKKYNVSDNVTLYCFDTFEGHSPDDISNQLDGPHKPGGFNNTSYESVTEYLRKFNNVKIIKGRFQDSANQINDLSFFFVHLDVDIFEPTIFALNFFKNKLCIGGCIVVDDYGFNSCPGAKKAVDEFLLSTNNFFQFHLLTGQCILIKIKND